MYIGKNRDPMAAIDKKVPRNPKYSKVPGTLDTGRKEKDVKHVTTREYIKRQNEIFQRILPGHLMALLSPDLNDISEQSMETQGEDKVLLLDLRDEADFNTCHIQSSAWYPFANFHQDRFSGDLYRFKNKPNKSIVVYDNDEKHAALAATILSERGYDNVRLLHGGLIAFGNKYSYMLVGELPPALVREKPISPSESLAKRRELRQERLMREAMFDSRSSAASGVSASSSVSHHSTFSRAPRWVDDRSGRYQHKETLARLHHTPDNSY